MTGVLQRGQLRWISVVWYPGAGGSECESVVVGEGVAAVVESVDGGGCVLSARCG